MRLRDKVAVRFHPTSGWALLLPAVLYWLDMAARRSDAERILPLYLRAVSHPGLVVIIYI